MTNSATIAMAQSIHLNKDKFSSPTMRNACSLRETTVAKMMKTARVKEFSFQIMGITSVQERLRVLVKMLRQIER